MAGSSFKKAKGKKLSGIRKETGEEIPEETEAVESESEGEVVAPTEEVEVSDPELQHGGVTYAGKFDPAILTYIKGNMKHAMPKMKMLPSIQTGIDCLDLILPGGGIPRRIITEIYGPESVGKTSMMLTMLKNAKELFIKEAKGKEPRKILYMDFENAMDYAYAASFGVHFYDPVTGAGDPMFQILHPTTAEEGLRLIQECQDEYHLYIVDSVASMLPEKEMENMETKQIGIKALSHQKFFTHVTRILRENDATMVCINQMRVKSDGHGGMENASAGGWAYRHFLSLRIELQPGKKFKSKVIDITTGEIVEKVRYEIIHAELEKNKRGERFTKTDLILRYGQGYDNITPMRLVLEKKNLVQNKVGVYRLVDVNNTDNPKLSVRGEEKFYAEIKANPELYKYMVSLMPYAKLLTDIRSGKVMPPSLVDLLTKGTEAALETIETEIVEE
jgi:RecA/RadA recombinase